MSIVSSDVVEILESLRKSGLFGRKINDSDGNDMRMRFEAFDKEWGVERCGENG